MQPLGDDGWYRAEAVTPDLTRIVEPFVHPFFDANIWHLRGDEADLVVDFGMGLRPLRERLAIPQNRRVIAVATHVHVDHVGCFHEFSERLGHATEADGFARMPDDATLAELFRRIDAPVTRLPHPGWRPEDYALTPATLTRVLVEGDSVVCAPYHFEVLHLPGHSPGSIGLYDAGRRILFAGDAIYAGGLVDDLPGADREAYGRTMRRLAALDVDMAFCGHNPPISGAEMRVIAESYLARSS